VSITSLSRHWNPAIVFLHISYFQKDPATILALKTVGEIFDHSDSVMLSFEEIHFLDWIWILFLNSADPQVHHWAMQVLNRWMHLPPGNQRICNEYKEWVNKAHWKMLDVMSEGVHRFVHSSLEAARNGGLLFYVNQIVMVAANHVIGQFKSQSSCSSWT
jgi:hypothetical protein